MEKRKSPRFDKVDNLKGKLHNVVNFHVKDISYYGINLICNLMANIGVTYNIIINKNDEKEEFTIKVIRSEAQPFESKYSNLQSGGMLFNIGAEFAEIDEKKKKFLEYIINEKEDLNGVLLL